MSLYSNHCEVLLETLCSKKQNEEDYYQGYLENCNYMFTLNSFLTKRNFLQSELFICHGFLRQSSFSFVKDHVNSRQRLQIFTIKNMIQSVRITIMNDY